MNHEIRWNQEIQRLTDCQTLEKATLRQNPRNIIRRHQVRDPYLPSAPDSWAANALIGINSTKSDEMWKLLHGNAIDNASLFLHSGFVQTIEGPVTT
jgi:hypothetical protein